MENLNKKLAYGLWAVSGIGALSPIIRYISVEYYVGIISLVITLAFQFLLGYTILRDKNDKFTMISVILITIFTFNLGGLAAIILRLVLRKNNSPKVRNAWFIPAIVTGVSSVLIPMIASSLNLIIVVQPFSLMRLITLAIDVAYYLIFGYWFIKYLKVR